MSTTHILKSGYYTKTTCYWLCIPRTYFITNFIV